MFLIQDFITFLNLHNGAKKKRKNGDGLKICGGGHPTAWKPRYSLGEK